MVDRYAVIGNSIAYSRGPRPDTARVLTMVRGSL